MDAYTIGVVIIVAGLIYWLLSSINDHTYRCQKPDCDFECYDPVEAAGHDALENKHKTV